MMLFEGKIKSGLRGIVWVRSHRQEDTTWLGIKRTASCMSVKIT